MASAPENSKFSITFKTPKPKVTAETSKKVRLAMNTAISKGTIAGVSRIETGLSAALDRAMEAPVWNWPNPTFRANGEIATNVRNIVDTGALKASKKITSKFSQTKSDVFISYSSPYALLVHYGGFIRPYGNQFAATKQLPARPWIRAVTQGGVSSIDKYDFDKEIRDEINKAWKAQFG
jgi:hypothetical protein